MSHTGGFVLRLDETAGLGALQRVWGLSVGSVYRRKNQGGERDEACAAEKREDEDPVELLASCGTGPSVQSSEQNRVLSRRVGGNNSTPRGFLRMLHFVVGAAEPTVLSVLLAVLLVGINGGGGANEKRERRVRTTSVLFPVPSTSALDPIFKTGF